MAGGGGNKKRFQYCTDSSGQEILYLWARHGHSRRNPIDPLLQDNVMIPNNIFQYIYHCGCAINLDSITNSGLIPGGQNLVKEKRQYSLRMWILWTRNTKIRTSLTWPHHVLQGTSKSGESAPRYGVLGRFSACSTERIEVLSNKIDRNHLLRHTPSLLYPESCCDGIWRNQKRESICVTSASSKDFL